MSYLQRWGLTRGEIQLSQRSACRVASWFSSSWLSVSGWVGEMSYKTLSPLSAGDFHWPTGT